MQKKNKLPKNGTQISHISCFFYALPAVSIYFLMGPMALLQGIYVKYYGVPISTIATVLLIARLADAVSDPIIGMLSDSWADRWGGRKTFMGIGAIIFLISGFFLYVPFDFVEIKIKTISEINSSKPVSTFYFLGWFLMFYLAYTFFTVPHYAWAADISEGSCERTRLYTWRASAVFLAGILFYMVPMLPIFESAKITPKTLMLSVFIAAFFMVPFLGLSLVLLPSKSSIKKNVTKTSNNRAPKFRLDMVMKNLPMMNFMAVFVVSNIAIGSWFTLLYIYVDGYLELGDNFAFISLIGMLSGFISLGLWACICDYLGKRNTWIASNILVTIGVIALGFLTPGEQSLMGLAVISAMTYAGFGAANILAPSMLTDINDYSLWKYQADYSATYFAIYTLGLKANFAIGGTIGFGLIGLYGFDVNALEHTEKSVEGLTLAFSIIPAIMLTLSVFILSCIKLDERRHNIIRRRLNNMCK